MSYLVMECRAGYAVVLDAEGNFLRVANMGYQVGQTVEEVIEEQIAAVTENLMSVSAVKKKRYRNLIRMLAAAACLCIVIFGTNRLFFEPYATVRIQINPDVMLSMNRFQYVVRVEGINEDGKALVEGYNYIGKDAMAVSEELTDRAKEMGYLNAGGDITLTVEGPREEWTSETEETMIMGLEHHCQGSVHVNSSSEEHDDEEHHRIESQGAGKHHGESIEEQQHHSAEQQAATDNTEAQLEEDKDGDTHSAGKHGNEGHNRH